MTTELILSFLEKQTYKLKQTKKLHAQFVNEFFDKKGIRFPRLKNMDIAHRKFEEKSGIDDFRLGNNSLDYQKES